VGKRSAGRDRRGAGGPVVGRVADRRSPLWTIGLGLVAMRLSYALVFGFGDRLWGLVAGVVLLDLGAQSCQISNQARIYGLKAEAHSRLNTVYMVAFFIGGAAGSYGGTLAWGRWGLPGVCRVATTLLLVAFIGLAVTATDLRWPRSARRRRAVPEAIAP
jgi:predicted MFS family arabinose efflux permease